MLTAFWILQAIGMFVIALTQANASPENTCVALVLSCLCCIGATISYVGCKIVEAIKGRG